MKLYAVTKGSYSDYHIVALTRFKWRAEKIAEKCSDKYDDAVVEEFEDTEVKERPLWDVLLYKRYGIRASEVAYEEQLSFNKPLNTVIAHFEGDVFEVYCEAKDEKHAKKIATDLLAEYCYERDMPIMWRREYVSPAIIDEMPITIGQWLEAGDNLFLCSVCRSAVSFWHRDSSCNACGAVMNAAMFYKEVRCNG